MSVMVHSFRAASKINFRRMTSSIVHKLSAHCPQVAKVHICGKCALVEVSMLSQHTGLPHLSVGYKMPTPTENLS